MNGAAELTMRVALLAMIRDHLACANVAVICLDCPSAYHAEQLRLELTPAEQARVKFRWPGQAEP